MIAYNFMYIVLSPYIAHKVLKRYTKRVFFLHTLVLIAVKLSPD